ncbi:MAG: hypothetical protein WCK67_12310 [bacterium]
MNINITNNYAAKQLAFRGINGPTAQMLAFSSQENRDRFLRETEEVRKPDLLDGQSVFSFLKDKASEIFTALNENPNQKQIKAGLDLIG